MKIQQRSSSKANGVVVLGLFFLEYLSSGSAFSATPIFDIVIIDRPLTVYSLPFQEGQAKMKFSFDLKSYISKIKPEVDYRVTLSPLLSRQYTSITLNPLPAGITRIYEGSGVCPRDPMTLSPGQSCILRFYVDKDRYPRSSNIGPVVCLAPSLTCSRPPLGHQIDDAVARMPGPTQIVVDPEVLDGLSYDKVTSSITGTPSRAGTFVFKISATNGSTTAAPQILQINVSINTKDKPVFKTSPNVASAMPEKEYRLNLMDLLEPTKGFMETNQITFELDENHPILSWLKLDKNNGTVLRGEVPKNAAGQTQEITINAISNTGGKSEPFLLKIPVAYDPAQKPILDKDLKLRASAGNAFHNDLRSRITDPTSDGNIKLIIEKIEPKAPWLTVSNSNPTELTGVVPPDAVGQSYQITLRANTTIGGSSEPETIPLNIAINKEKTPRFYQDNPQLPLLYEGQPYSYDFVVSRDVYPEYKDVPYIIELADGYNNPDWVHINDNQLIVEQVPEHLEQMEQVFITIKNTPGGPSEVLTLKLFIMN